MHVLPRPCLLLVGPRICATVCARSAGICSNMSCPAGARTKRFLPRALQQVDRRERQNAKPSPSAPARTLQENGRGVLVHPMEHSISSRYGARGQSGEPIEQQFGAHLERNGCNRRAGNCAAEASHIQPDRPQTRAFPLRSFCRFASLPGQCQLAESEPAPTQVKEQRTRRSPEICLLLVVPARRSVAYVERKRAVGSIDKALCAIRFSIGGASTRSRQ
jgi:hypothetical protein